MLFLGYWTAGRDAGNPTQYVWDRGTLGSPALGAAFSGFSADITRSCVLFRAGSVYGDWRGSDCNSTNPVICQK